MSVKRKAGLPDIPEAVPPEQHRRIVHELRMLQIEMETQNEELRRVQEELDIQRARYVNLYDLAPVSCFTVSDRGRSSTPISPP